MELSPLEKSRCRFHLGVSLYAGIDAGDAAQIEEAMAEITDDYTYGRVLEQLDICDEAEAATRLTRTSDGRYTTRELYTGDLNRAILRDAAKDGRIWEENYIKECERLAQLLWVPCYRTPGAERWRYERSAGAFVRSLPGIADTSVSSRRLELVQLGGSFGY